MYRLAVSAAAIAAALVVSEFAVRFVYRDDTSSGNAGDYIARRGGEPHLTVNSLGFRERQVGQKDPNRYRIAVVGDSFTWGQGVDEAQRFSNVLGDLLGSHYDVLNFGMSGHTLPEHVDELDPVLRVKPDFVLLQLYINNFETPAMRRPQAHALLPEDLNSTMTQTSLVYQLMTIDGRSFRKRSAWWTAMPATSPVICAILIRRTRAKPSESCGSSSAGRARAVYRRAWCCSRQPIRWAPTAGIIRSASCTIAWERSALKSVFRIWIFFRRLPASRPHSLWVSPFDAHPNAAANRLAATEILGEFGPVWRR